MQLTIESAHRYSTLEFDSKVGKQKPVRNTHIYIYSQPIDHMVLVMICVHAGERRRMMIGGRRDVRVCRVCANYVCVFRSTKYEFSPV